MPKPNSETWISMNRILINSYPTFVDAEIGRPVLQTYRRFTLGQAANASGVPFTNDCAAADDLKMNLTDFRNRTPTPNGLIGTFTIVQYISEVETLLRNNVPNDPVDTFKQFPASNVFENLQDYFDLADPSKNIIQGVLDSASGKVKFQSLGHGLVDDDAITVTGSSVAAYNRRQKVRKLNNNEFRTNVNFAGNTGACTFKKASFVRAAGVESTSIGVGDQLADYWIDLRNATIREIHATKIANRALERSGAAPWFGTKLLCMDVMTHPMFIGPPSAPYADWPSQVDFIMRLKNKIRAAGLYVDSLIGWNLMNSSAEADIDAMSEYMDGVYLEGFLQKANVDNSTGTTQIRRLRRFHSNGRGCLTYLQPRRGIKTVDPINADDFQRVLIPTSVTPVTGGVEVVCDRPHHLDLTHQKTAYLFDVNGTKSGNSINISKIIRAAETVTDKKVKLLIPVSAEQPDTISPLVGTSRIYFNGADNEVQAMVAMWVTGDEAGNAGIWRPYQQVTAARELA